MREFDAKMKLLLLLKSTLLVGALLGSVTNGWALTLGHLRGPVVLGQSLGLVASVQPAVDEDISGLCFSAEVFYGENRIDPDKVDVTLTRSPSGPVHVHVHVHLPVDEPVVTVNVRSSCGQQTSRRYVLFSELTSEVLPPVNAEIGAGVVPQAFQTRTVTDATNKRASVEPGVSQSSRKTQPQQSLNANLNPRHLKKGVNSRNSELKLALVDLRPEIEPDLKASNELIFPQVESSQTRESAKKLWSSLNANPEGESRQAARIQAMTETLDVLRDQSERSRLMTTGLIVRLKTAEASRFANPLVVALLLLLAGSGATCMYLWRGPRLPRLSQSPWWGENNSENRSDTKGFVDSTLGDAISLAKAKDVHLASSDIAEYSNPAAALTVVDIDLQLAESAFSDLGQPVSFEVDVQRSSPTAISGEPSNARQSWVSNGDNAASPISSQQILDSRQEAEFFMTLGQYDEAISVLQRCVRERGVASPLVYLDLLTIFHTLSRKMDYESMCVEFNQQFTGVAPHFSRFGERGLSLEMYPEVLNKIVATWSTMEAVDYIEQCLVRSLSYDPASGFDLDAYRDLLMLSDIAKQISPSQRGVLPMEIPQQNLKTSFDRSITSTTAGLFLKNSGEPDASAHSNSIEFELVKDEFSKPYTTLKNKS